MELPTPAISDLLERRRQLVDDIEPMFPPSTTRIPAHTIFRDSEDAFDRLVVVPDSQAIADYNKTRQSNTGASTVVQSAAMTRANSLQSVSTRKTAAASNVDLTSLPVGIIQEPVHDVVINVGADGASPSLTGKQ